MRIEQLSDRTAVSCLRIVLSDYAQIPSKKLVVQTTSFFDGGFCLFRNNYCILSLPQEMFFCLHRPSRKRKMTGHSRKVGPRCGTCFLSHFLGAHNLEAVIGFWKIGGPLDWLPYICQDFGRNVIVSLAYYYYALLGGRKCRFFRANSRNVC